MSISGWEAAYLDEGKALTANLASGILLGTKWKGVDVEPLGNLRTTREDLSEGVCPTSRT